MSTTTDKKLSRDIATRLKLTGADLTSVLEAARHQYAFTPGDANDGAIFRKVLSACAAGDADTLSIPDWQTASSRAAAFIASAAGTFARPSAALYAARSFHTVVSARLALVTATRPELVSEHQHRQAALQLLESFYASTTGEAGTELDLRTAANGASAIAEFELATGRELEIVDFLEKCKSSAMGQRSGGPSTTEGLGGRTTVDGRRVLS